MCIFSESSQIWQLPTIEHNDDTIAIALNWTRHGSIISFLNRGIISMVCRCIRSNIAEVVISNIQAEK